MTPLAAAVTVLALTQGAAAMIWLAAYLTRWPTVRASMRSMMMATAILLIIVSVPACYVVLASVQTIFLATYAVLTHTPTPEGKNR